ncbi:DNA cytosine methyltransferase [Priestia megaterium]
MATAISFFSGAGGLDIGLQEAGFDIKLSVEIEKVYCETLKMNHPKLNIIQGDIMKFNKTKVYKAAGLSPDDTVDLMVGGSPCQSFSTAGKRQAFSDPRGQAMLHFADLVTEIRPQAFLLENVKGLLSAALKHRPLNQRGKDFPPLELEEQAGSAVSYLLRRFKGYHIEYRLINSADYGVPQKRERVFFVGIRKDLRRKIPRFPIQTHSKDGLNGKEKWVPVSKVLWKLTEIEHHHMNYSKERLKYMEMIPSGGGNWRDLPADVVREAMGGAFESGGGKVGFFRRIHHDRPSPTLLTSPVQKSTNIGHPFEDRPLSIEEYLAIQEFPEGYKVAGSLAQQYTQIGNAVPVKLGKVMGTSILKAIITKKNKYNRARYRSRKRNVLKKRLGRRSFGIKSKQIPYLEMNNSKKIKQAKGTIKV